MTAVSEVLGALGFTCVADDDGGLAFSGPGGRGHAFEDSPESVRVSLVLNGDLIENAARLVQLSGRKVAEPAAARRLLSLPDPPDRKALESYVSEAS